MEKKCIELNISIYNNLAACLLQITDSKAERIKEVTEVVIELDPSNEKAWFRQGWIKYPITGGGRTATHTNLFNSV